jgi:nucleoside-diphosphate-sugar epimerase
MADSNGVVAVTGASGFIGLSLTQQLLANGRNVVAHALDALPAQALAEFARLPGSLTVVRGDIRDPHLRQCLGDHRVTQLFHGAVITAAQEREKTSSREILDVNVLGTVNALDACVHAGVTRVVLASSSAVYGDAIFGTQDLGEDHVLEPANLYGIGKVAIEGIGRRYEALHGLRVVLARITAAYGPWERDTGLRDTLSPLWQVARCWAAGSPVALVSGGRRDWVHSARVAPALEAMLDREHLAHRIYNLSAGRVWHPSTFCQALQALDPGFAWSVVESQARSNIQLYDPLSRERCALGTARARQEGWCDSSTLDADIAQYATWVVGHRDWFR